LQRTVKRIMRALTGVVLATALVACSEYDADGDATSGSGDTGAAEQPVTITVTEQAGEVDPLGEVVEVERGQEIELVVSSDAEDEFHLHSDPEQEFPIEAASDQRFTFSIDTPGTYELESHELEVTIVKLQVT
jgi:hypothetical protein